VWFPLKQRIFKFYPSRLLALCICLGHAVAIGALAALPVPRFAFMLLLAVLLLSTAYYLQRHARLALANAWVGLRLHEDHLVLCNRRGDELMGRLLGSSVVMPHLVILNISIPNYRQTQNVVLMPDSMDEESFRQLRVALKWGVTLTA
jgi:toxin CptA